MNVNPVKIFADTSVDSGKVRPSAADNPGDEADEHGTTVFLERQWAARVALAGVFTTCLVARAQHLLAVPKRNFISIVAPIVRLLRSSAAIVDQQN